MFYEFNHFGISEYFHKEYGKNFSYPMHLHHSFELISVTSGEMEVTADSHTYRLSSGQSVLIFPNQLHSLSSINSQHMLCIFSPELVKAYASKVAEKRPTDNVFSPDAYLIEQLDNICENASAIEKKGILYSLCAQFDREVSYSDVNADDKNLLYRIFDFIEHNYSKECSLYSLADKTGYSYSYLSRYFKGIVGISFNDCVNRYRLSNACYMLSNSDCSVLRCALDSGFGSLRSFNRNFTAYLSVSPREYRENIYKSAKN
ncbi:MAG: helix-turn-helix transcriptional regulator [Clostridia bacterium]|nr:helix-turn-helix transcriptional regulator [Clostridia bacterium]